MAIVQVFDQAYHVQGRNMIVERLIGLAMLVLIATLLVVEPLLNPPTDGPLFCVDEKPGIGVWEPTAPDQPPARHRRPARSQPVRPEFE